ncbi:hypothetical protein BMS3Abin10_02416 [bacterium BMS3Abin10]|nr:hypothetical protein BMS3Abin10_02416 [bacterium BMS3Abin10]GBE38949.1 hypothetical protein BMS3Bbin08_01566 [bacterium BMS3Bbin08]
MVFIQAVFLKLKRAGEVRLVPATNIIQSMVSANLGHFTCEGLTMIECVTRNVPVLLVNVVVIFF